MFRVPFLFGCLTILAWIGNISAETTLSVGVDSSLRGVMQDLAQAWADSQDQGKVELSVANLATLRSQLEKGSDLDVAIIPNKTEAQALVDHGKLLNASQKQIASNTLVALGRKPLVASDEQDWFELIGNEWKRITIPGVGLTGSGKAAQAALQKHGLWEDVKTVVQSTSNETTAVDFARRNETDVVFAWSTDIPAQGIEGFQVFKIDSKDYPPMLYIASIVAATQKTALAKEFISFLVSDAALPIWKKWGFLVGSS